MKKTALSLLFFSLSLAGWAQRLYQPSVLIEMFSSEGCSSCPLADEFAQEITALADSSHSPVFVIDYHVDIWNRSGWVDPFSDTVYTDRQTDYMKRAGQKAMFTPMMFINGKHGMPAGDKKGVGNSIYNELSEGTPVTVSVNASLLGDGKTIGVSYNISDRRDSLQFVVVLAEKEVSSKVTGGENAGKTLVHHRVVRSVKIVPVKDELTGIVTIAAPADPDLEKYIILGFVQHSGSWHVYSTDQVLFRRAK